MSEDEADDRGAKGEEDDGTLERSEPHVNARPGAHDSALHPDQPETMQHDHEDAPGRQRYADARPSDYDRDFQSDESDGHPVKEPHEGAVDEDGIPEIASRKPPEER